MKLYEPKAVSELLREIHETDQTIKVEEKEKSPGYCDIFCGAEYRRATFVGIGVSIFQQLAGINVIDFYSGTILIGLDLTVNEVNLLVGAVTLVSTCIGVTLLDCFGRRTLMVVGNALMAVCLFALGFGLNHNIKAASIGGVFGFISFFSISSGPICFLYMAEIMTDKAMSIGVVLNWAVVLVIASVTPSIVDQLGDSVGYIFMFVGAMCVLATIFFLIFMKETKGKTRMEIERMYSGEAKNDKESRYPSSLKGSRSLNKTNDIF